MFKKIFKRLFCVHNYQLINQFEIKSEFDIVVENGKIPNTWNRINRKVITDYKCSECNKLKRFEETNR